MAEPKLAWFVGQRPIDALGAMTGRVARIVACEGGTEAAAIGARLSCRVDCLEDLLGIRRVWTSATVAEAAATLLQAGDGPQSAAEVLVYATSHRLETLLARTAGVLRAPPAGLAERTDDKIAMRQALRRLGVPVPECVTTTAGELSFERLAPGLGLPLVIQRPQGSAGIGTWVAHDRDELAVIHEGVDPTQPLLVSRFAGEIIVNVHAAVSGSAICVSPMSVQAVGISGLCDGAARYCGNDFSAARALDPALRDAITAHTSTIVRSLARDGFRGTLGVDFATDGTRAFALEVNPRMQGSTWLLAELERADGRPSIAHLHSSAWNGPAFAAAARQYTSAALDGAMVVLHRATGTASSVLTAGLQPGVHAFDAGVLSWLRPGCSPLDCFGSEVVVGALAGSDVQIAPDAVLARISSRQSLVADDGRALSSYGRRILAAITRRSADVPSAPS